MVDRDNRPPRARVPLDPEGTGGGRSGPPGHTRVWIWAIVLISIVVVVIVIFRNAR
jgi:hypothetical protein